MTTENANAGAPNELPPNAIAVIGMAGRFPGADSLTQFWDNLRRGEESVTTLSEEAQNVARNLISMTNLQENIGNAAELRALYGLYAAERGGRPRSRAVGGVCQSTPAWSKSRRR